jgi:hypothetical protein
MNVPNAAVIIELASATLIHESAISTVEMFDAFNGLDQTNFVPETWHIDVEVCETLTAPDWLQVVPAFGVAAEAAVTEPTDKIRATVATSNFFNFSPY